jgi:hypothetical protein
MKTVADLNHSHIGQQVRVQCFDGGYVEGTLARIDHKVKEPYSKFIETWLAFEEFTLKVGRESAYIPFATIGNRSAQSLEDDDADQ